MGAFADRVYTGAAYLAGAFLVGTLVAVSATIFGRLLHFDTPGFDAYAGYSMAASSFLALAHTLRRGEHIRVTLILQHLGPGARRAFESVCNIVAVAISGALAWFSIRLVWLSYIFNDVSTSLDATPLWIPQIGMAAGAILLFCSFLQSLLEWVLKDRTLPSAGAVRAAQQLGE